MNFCVKLPQLIKNDYILSRFSCKSLRLYCGSNRFPSPEEVEKVKLGFKNVDFNKQDFSNNRPFQSNYARPTDRRQFLNESRRPVSFIKSPAEMDKEDYSRFCSDLKSDSSKIDLSRLPIIPFACQRFNDEFHFVENVLTDYFSVLVRNREKISKMKLFPTIFGLHKLNVSTNGKVLEVISWNSIEEMTIFILKDISLLFATLLKYDLLVNGLKGFVNDYGVECSMTLHEHLVSAFAAWLPPPVDIAAKFPFPVLQRTGKILFNLTRLDVKNPSEKLVEKIVPLFNESLTVSKMMSSDFNAFRNLVHFAEALSIWNVNMDLYCNEAHWQNFYKCVENHYRCVPYLSDVFSSFALKCCLMVAYKFDKEEDFMIIRILWLINMNIALNAAFDKKLKVGSMYRILKATKNIIEQMKLKYADNPTKLETLLSSAIIKKFDELN